MLNFALEGQRVFLLLINNVFFTVQRAEWVLGSGCGWEQALPSCAGRALMW